MIGIQRVHLKDVKAEVIDGQCLPDRSTEKAPFEYVIDFLSCARDESVVYLANDLGIIMITGITWFELPL